MGAMGYLLLKQEVLAITNCLLFDMERTAQKNKNKYLGYRDRYPDDLTSLLTKIRGEEIKRRQTDRQQDYLISLLQFFFFQNQERRLKIMYKMWVP
jgi:hypothetical protein